MSQASQRILRRLPPSRVADFDDQLWPVNCAILILAGFAVGLAMATGDFHAERLLENTWFRLGLVGSGVAALFAAVIFLRRKMVRRVQLCVVISLLVHLWLGMALHRQYLAAVAAWNEAEAAPLHTEPARVVSVPDYHWENFQRPQHGHTFDEPLQTEAPKAANPEPLKPRRIEHEIPPEKRPHTEPERPRQQRPKPAELRRAQPSAPRHASLAAGAQISRQPWRQIAHPDEPIPLPEAVAREEELPDRPRADVSAPDHRRSKVPVHQRRVFDRQPSATDPQPVAKLARRAKHQEQPADRPTTPTPMRKLTRPVELAAAEVVLPKATPQVEPRPRRADPAESRPARRTAASPPAHARRPTAPVPRVTRPEQIAKPSPEAAKRGASPRALADVRPSLAATERVPKIARADRGSRLPAISGVPLASAKSGDRGSSEAKTADRGRPKRLEAGTVGDARRVASAETSVGSKGRATAEPLTGASMLGPVSSTPGLEAGPRRRPAGDESAAAPAAETGGAPLGKTDTAGLSLGLTGPVDVVAAGPVQAASAEEGEAPESSVRAAVGLQPRGRPGGLPVEIADKQGPGGLSHEPSPQVGIPGRRARTESETVHVATRRFLIDRGGGTLSVEGPPLELPTEAFRQRDPGQRARRVEIYGGTDGTQRAVEMGLKFLVQCQFDDGHWSLDGLPEKLKDAKDPALGQMTSDTAATGLALLSFLGAGYTHQSEKHRAVVRRGLDWLIEHQKQDGDLFTGGTRYAWLYSHGIATIALCEAYGMTRDPELREPVRRAVGFIVVAQNPRRGGWRYRPQVESDTSVAGWQLMALKSAQMAELDVPTATLEGVSRWLDRAQSQGGARYAYNPYAGNTPEQRAGRRPSLAMTAEGSLMRMYLGRRRDDPAMRDAADYLKANLPTLGTADRPSRDVYYWYYATQVMFQMQGEYWEAWNNRLRPLLERTQVSSGKLAGSWHPTAPYRDRWGHAGGRLYVTTMNLLMLEVYYRHLPLFQTLE